MPQESAPSPADAPTVEERLDRLSRRIGDLEDMHIPAKLNKLGDAVTALQAAMDQGVAWHRDHDKDIKRLEKDIKDLADEIDDVREDAKCAFHGIGKGL